jgi:signal transduction histidine kinase
VLHLIVDLPDDRLPSAVETTAFRILQEALSNVRKYAAPANLRISLVQTDATFEGTVADDGPGFDINLVTVSPDGGFGLRSMQERQRCWVDIVRLKATSRGGRPCISPYR